MCRTTLVYCIQSLNVSDDGLPEEESNNFDTTRKALHICFLFVTIFQEDIQ